ncbi:hypothetical protein R3I93_008943 [Phoxinus phoxinus]|uniref:Uncharacterized protein n=1 Tax=Phoxinus phoxinus TaxID=58324 RepID=A0AAN9D7T9_9TELE
MTYWQRNCNVTGRCLCL